MAGKAQKKSFYEELNKKLYSLVSEERDLIANLANAAALLFNELERINWAGFYLLKEDELVLGPFQGKPACVRIPLEKGVCGTAAAKRETIVVEDVHQFPGHIACDAASNSEIVIPIIVNGVLKGVLDIDSPEYARFDQDDKESLEAFLNVLKTNCRW
ncbi:MAG: GAF domain-containing protein [Firmicutes bacterium]|nr:GAF domain-containing protein [Bacillota bacterium]